MNRFLKLLDWLYPPKCIACRTLIPLNKTQPRDMLICEPCQTLFEPIDSCICKYCGMPTEVDVERCVSCFGKAFSFDRNYATFVYEDLIRDLLLDLKFNQKKQIAYSLGMLWAEHVQRDCIVQGQNSLSVQPCSSNIYLVPLPMHPKKQRERGFNQAEVLAKAVGERLGIPIVNALERVLDTPPQSGLHPRQRVENIRGAFAVVKNESPQGKHYIVVDDIYTTGASLNECARVLKEAGASSICGLTLSVVKKKKEKE